MNTLSDEWPRVFLGGETRGRGCDRRAKQTSPCRCKRYAKKPKKYVLPYPGEGLLAGLAMRNSFHRCSMELAQMRWVSVYCTAPLPESGRRPVVLASPNMFYKREAKK